MPPTTAIQGLPVTIAAAPPVLEPVDEAALAALALALAAEDDAAAPAPEVTAPVLVTSPEPVTRVEKPCVLVIPLPIISVPCAVVDPDLVAAADALEADAEANKLALLALLLESKLWIAATTPVLAVGRAVKGVAVPDLQVVTPKPMLML